MIVLDASVIIAHLDGQDAHHRRATTVLAGAVAEGFGVSPLTLAEVLVGPTRAGRLPAALAAVEAIGHTSGWDALTGATLALGTWR